MKLLVTGGAGFIGSALIRLLLRESEGVEVVNLDALTYAGSLENLGEWAEHPRHRFVHGDVADPDAALEAMIGAEAVIHVAAESHVDRSIHFDQPFIRTNVVGTRLLLSLAVELGVRRFVQISTDEVYGELPWRDPETEVESGRRFTEETALAPRSPYSASKAAADHLALAYHATHGLDVVVVRCTNNYGPYQFPEKLIPKLITCALAGRPLPLYGDGLHVRDWIHVDDNCRGIVAALEQGRAGEVYNLGAEGERTNMQIARAILAELGKPSDLIEHVSERPGHDRRYAVDPAKAERELELAWTSQVSFEAGFPETVRWYVENESWCQRALGRIDLQDYRP